MYVERNEEGEIIAMFGQDQIGRETTFIEIDDPELIQYCGDNDIPLPQS